jgi:lipoprotein NlpI
MRGLSVLVHSSRVMVRHLALILALLALTGGRASAAAAGPPISPTERAALLADLTSRIRGLARSIEQSPREPSLYSQRGDAHLFLGQFAAAVADFEKMIALDRALDAPHWRLGIAYYFAGRFRDSSAQFAKYHAYDNRDRENGLWKFLGDAKLLGLSRAREAMLPYTQFDREPFPTLYELYAGRMTSSAFIADLQARRLDVDSRVMFFANYYTGLHAALLGDHASALPRLHAAVANPWARSAENGPAYMWQVARLHYEQLAAHATPQAAAPR